MFEEKGEEEMKMLTLVATLQQYAATYSTSAVDVRQSATLSHLVQAERKHAKNCFRALRFKL